MSHQPGDVQVVSPTSVGSITPMQNCDEPDAIVGVGPADFGSGSGPDAYRHVFVN
ncbi:MAG: hypothetical protein QM286_02160 [Acidobacteriota bacterium]|nr:hypothetical protein [Acidobacteriota bacterium]